MAAEAYSAERISPPARKVNGPRMIVQRMISSNVRMTESYRLSARFHSRGVMLLKVERD